MLSGLCGERGVMFRIRSIFPLVIFVLAFLSGSTAPRVALGDGLDSQALSETTTFVPSEEAEPFATKGEQRLPPVIPGERVRDSGRTLRVYSTAGPVPVASAVPQAPAPGVPAGGQQGSDIQAEIVIDRR